MNRQLLLSAAALILLAACGGKPPAPAPAAAPETPPAAAAAPAPVEVESLVEVSATVDAIDMANRLVTLRGDDGEISTVQVSDEVQNLPQVKVGDRVTARYYRAIGAQIATATTPDATTVDLAGGRAAPGERPAAAVGRTATVPVTITAVRSEGKSVSFYGEDGLVRVIEVQDPKAQEFVRGLKEGDKVELTFTEAVAISVEPAAAETPPAP